MFTISLLCGILAFSAAPPPPGPLLISGAHVLAPSGDKWLEGRSVLVRNGRIAEIEEKLIAPPDVRRIELKGAYLLPGLIDLHSHLLLHPYDEAKWDDQVLRESLELRTIRAVAAARATLEAGFTSLRDLGTEGAGFADVALRDAITRGIVPGPRLFASTRAIVATACYGPSGFDPRWDVPKGAQPATGADEVRRAVREQIAAGADWIKVYADYRRRAGDPATPTLSQEELNAAVSEAQSAGIPVAAHASTAEGMLRAARAGVTTIEHGYGATEEVWKLMIDRGVVLCPTLAAAEAVARYAGWKPDTPEPEGLRTSRRSFRAALQAGVTIACGSDVGVFAHGQNARELELMVACGMTPQQALRAATATAATVLKRGRDLGRIDKGCVADLVAVRTDPLADVSALRQPLAVVKEGFVVFVRP